MIEEGRYINSECKLIFGMSRNEEISQLDIELLNYLFFFLVPSMAFLFTEMFSLTWLYMLMLGCAQRECLSFQ